MAFTKEEARRKVPARKNRLTRGANAGIAQVQVGRKNPVRDGCIREANPRGG